MPTAILLATAPAGDRPAAGLAWDDGTVLRRLVEQLAGLGVGAAHVITRPAWAPEVQRAVDGLGPAVRVHAADDLAGDLRAVAEVARGVTGGLVIAHADVVTQREALAGLLADPRVATGLLSVGGRRPLTFRLRTSRGRVVSAGSAYHRVSRPNLTSLGILKVTDADRAALAGVAERLAALTTPPLPADWPEALDQRADAWRHRLARAAATGEPEDGRIDDEVSAAVDDIAGGPGLESDEEGGDGLPALGHAVLSAEDEAEVERRLAVVREDATALLVVGLVRAGLPVGVTGLRKLFWTRAASDEAVARAREEIAGHDEDRALLESAVKATDGFFTSFFVSPYSKYIARWAARRGFTPNQVTTVSLLIGVVAAVAFATGERAGLVAGAVLVHLAFVTDCVDGQLARYTRTFSKLGAWLDSVFDRTKEYLVFAGLAIGASRAGDPVWVLAGAALTLQTVRHVLDFSFAASQHQVIGSTRHAPLEQPWDGRRPPSDRTPSPPGGAPPAPAPPPPSGLRTLAGRSLGLWRRLDRLPGALWVKRIIAFPIGERFAVIALTAALFTPQTTFVVLLAAGGFAALYATAGRVLRSVG